MNRVEKSMEFHKKGYNCAQAVVCSFLDKMGISEKEAFKVKLHLFKYFFKNFPLS